MKLTELAAYRVVERGLDYYLNGNVSDIMQTGSSEFQASVLGNGEEPYIVKINLEKPRSSSCTCPYATGTNVCKHMIALYYAINSAEADEFVENRRLYEEYDDEDDDYDEYKYYEDDEYGHYDNGHEGYGNELPFKINAEFEADMIMYNDMLDDYLNSLSEIEIRELLKEMLNEDRNSTYFRHLRCRRDIFIHKRGDSYSFINTLNVRMAEMAQMIDYEWKDYSQPFLKEAEKGKLISLWNDEEYKDTISQVFMRPELAVYDEYRWIVMQLKEHLSEDDIVEYIRELNNQLLVLKGENIRNTVPKSNVLICIYLLNQDLGKGTLGAELLNNAKYSEYVKYVINDTESAKWLYRVFMKAVVNNPYRNKSYIPDVLHELYMASGGDQDIFLDYCRYQYLNTNDVECLHRLEEAGKLEEFEKEIESAPRTHAILTTVYKYTGETDKLFNYLLRTGSDYILINHIDYLKEDYSDELYKYLRERMYDKLSEGKRREVYREAATYVLGIAKLKDGKRKVEEILSSLRVSKYSKCKLLFDIIENRLLHLKWNSD
ncbi:MAG: hypothetical protein IJH64_14305 [Oscillospiraceae bacterium]|nr:hypothetical protein [Oscillospiraceae bacterium]